MPESLSTAMKIPAATVEKVSATVDSVTATVDNVAATVGSVAVAGKAVLDSPAGQLVPPDMRLYGSLALSLLMGGTAAYKNWRLAQMGKATKAIVRGIEAAEAQPRGATTDNPDKSVKPAIAAEMRKLGVYDAGNKLVGRLKLS
jgi:hypothetical protein